MLKYERWAKAQKQQRCRESADDRDGQFDLDKLFGDILVDKPRQPRADAHREKINADDDRKLRDRIAENVA